MIGPAAYADAAGGKRVTESVIAAGADVIFGQGDGSSFGMIEAVENARADGGEVWFIDVIGDKTSIDKGHLLSSVVWNMVPVYDPMVQDLKADAFGTKGYSIGLKDDFGAAPEDQAHPRRRLERGDGRARQDPRRQRQGRADLGRRAGPSADELGRSAAAVI